MRGVNPPFWEVNPPRRGGLIPRWGVPVGGGLVRRTNPPTANTRGIGIQWWRSRGEVISCREVIAIQWWSSSGEVIALREVISLWWWGSGGEVIRLRGVIDLGGYLFWCNNCSVG